jgi:CubicO group peptidase (beta-lactamase class C family)
VTGHDLDLAALCDAYDIVGAVVGSSIAGERMVTVHGLANASTGAPMDRSTFLLAGSVTKAMTASVVALLVADGRVDLDAPVISLVEQFRVADPDATAAITVRHLLSHTSGFDGDIWPDVGDGDDAIARVVASLGRCAQQSAPGTAFSYNNAAYAVLGRVIEQVTGTTFEVALRSLIAEPCGATFTTDAALIDRAATAVGHLPAPDGTQQPLEQAIGPACLAPAGSRTWATIDDLLAFGELHLGRHGDRAVHDSLIAMRRPQLFVDDPNNGGTMALGVFLDDRWGTPVVLHDGGVAGQAAYLRILPEHDAVLAVMSTGGVAQVFHRHVFARSAEHLLGVDAPLGVRVDPACAIDAPRYVGRFESSSTRLDVSVADDGGLTAALTWGRGTPAEVATGPLPLRPHRPEVLLAPLGGRDYVLVYPAGDRPDHVLAGLRRLDRVPGT